VKRFIRFCIAGTIGFVVDAGALELLVRAVDASPYAARIGSFLCAATVTWWINRHYTFEAARAPTGAEWLGYVGLMVIGAAVNYGTYAAAITWWGLAREHLWLGVALGSIAGLGVNFLTSKRLLQPA
jgi:putative flippase GtrA